MRTEREVQNLLKNIERQLDETAKVMNAHKPDSAFYSIAEKNYNLLTGKYAALRYVLNI